MQIKSYPWGARAVILASFAALLACSSKQAHADQNICEREMMRASRLSGVPLEVLYAVALTETGQKGTLNPYALNIAGRPRLTSNLHDALVEFTKAHEQGVKLIDVGCMQINHFYHGRRFSSTEEMFDPATNVGYASQFLKLLKLREGSWTAAVARYHAGPANIASQKSYVCAVIGNMVASGFGSWTREAKSFCRH